MVAWLLIGLIATACLLGVTEHRVNEDKLTPSQAMLIAFLAGCSWMLLTILVLDLQFPAPSLMPSHTTSAGSSPAPSSSSARPSSPAP